MLERGVTGKEKANYDRVPRCQEMSFIILPKEYLPLFMKENLYIFNWMDKANKCPCNSNRKETAIRDLSINSVTMTFSLHKKNKKKTRHLTINLGTK